MIAGETIQATVRRAARELSGVIAAGLADPGLSRLAEMQSTVLGVAAARIELEERLMESEIEAIVAAGLCERPSQGTAAERYEKVGRALGEAADGAFGDEELHVRVQSLIAQRVANETQLLGAGFALVARA